MEARTLWADGNEWLTDLIDAVLLVLIADDRRRYRCAIDRPSDTVG